ncbi:ABC transporter permease [Paracidovorax oryzae]|uniref:ABC transporter permease n=1 Tax=Paracidovorax oryzae TaxID=862720 RepID=UPI001ED94A75|nr:ABC transporter permease [Paracidovorax oryzae]
MQSTMRPLQASLMRIAAISVRHLVVLLRSWPRLVESVYMPTATLMQWVIFKNYLSAKSLPTLGSTLLVSYLMWEIIFRFKQGTVMSLFTEMWGRALPQLFTTPLTPLEMMFGCFIVGLVRAVLGIGIAVAVALGAGWSDYIELRGSVLVVTVFALMSSAAVSLIMSGVILRWGIAAEILSWALVLTLAPLSGVLYPTSALPLGLQWVSALLPTTYVFDCVRELLATGAIMDGTLTMVAATASAWLAIGLALFLAMFENTRKSGLLDGGPVD